MQKLSLWHENIAQGTKIIKSSRATPKSFFAGLFLDFLLIKTLVFIFFDHYWSFHLRVTTSQQS